MYFRIQKMIFLIFQIFSLVDSNSFGCNDIYLPPNGDRFQSKCHMQARGRISEETLKEAVGCCMSNTVGNERVFSVPFMQLRKLNRRERRIIRRKRNYRLANVTLIEENPKCYPGSKKDLKNFNIFLDELKARSNEFIENRWDCFLTNDFHNDESENNFCRRVFSYLANENRLNEMQKRVCDLSGRSILPHSKNRNLRLGNLEGIFKRPGLN